MKTTLKIPDALFRQVKVTAAQEDRTMKEFITEALTEKLASKADQGWRAVLGKLTATDRKAAREVAAAIAQADFNQVDPSAWR